MFCRAAAAAAFPFSLSGYLDTSTLQLWRISTVFTLQFKNKSTCQHYVLLTAHLATLMLHMRVFAACSATGPEFIA
jgi:hypothetical protein